MRQLHQILARPILHICVLSIGVNLLLLAPSLFMMQVFDRVLVSQSMETLAALGLGTLIALLMLFALDHLRSRLQGVVGNLIGDALLPEVVRVTVERSALAAGHPTNEAVRDVAALRQLCSAQGLLAVLDAPWLLVYVAVIAWIHPLLGLTAAVAAGSMLGLALLNDLLTRHNILAMQHQAASARNYLDHALRRVEVLQSLGMTDAMLKRWADRNAKVAELQRPTAIRSVAMAAAARVVRQLMQVAMLSMGAYLVLTQRGTPGIMIATTVLLSRALGPVEQIVASWRVLAEGRQAWRRLTALLGDDDRDGSPMALPPPSGELTATNVSLRLPGSERIVLAGVSLEIRSGEALAIIGPSAAGKSSLLRVLVGLWRPTTGIVRLDGADLSQWRGESMGPWIGYMPQDVQLFPGTVAENIARLGQVDADRVVQAAIRAKVHDMILSLPQGYDTVLSDGGDALSPGQRQRIALARALYGDVKLLILDEPNANLDGVGEQALAEVMKELRGHVTVVVVTHRSPLIQHVDKILVLEGGRVKHHGPRIEVLNRMSQATGTVVPLQRPGAGRASASTERRE